MRPQKEKVWRASWLVNPRRIGERGSFGGSLELLVLSPRLAPGISCTWLFLSYILL